MEEISPKVIITLLVLISITTIITTFAFVYINSYNADTLGSSDKRTDHTTYHKQAAMIISSKATGKIGISIEGSDHNDEGTY